MASTIADLGNSFIGCADSLQWRIIEAKANAIVHTEDCCRYSYFFEEESSFISNRHPCMLGYKKWTISMGAKYLDERSQICNFSIPKIDYQIVKYWEAHIPPYPPLFQTVKETIEKHWNFVRHLAKEVKYHSQECKRFKKETGKDGCLEYLHEYFTKWDESHIREYYEPKNICNF